MEDIIIFTDGSSRGNPGPGGWAALLTSQEKVVELGGREMHTTNNRMELTGAIRALLFVNEEPEFAKHSNITLYTDSQYLINGITKWVHGWLKNEWITSTKEEVMNKDLWQMLVKVTTDKNIAWRYVGGHVGIKGNERCDTIATAFADGLAVDLYNGPREKYAFTIKDLSLDSSLEKEKSQSKNRSKAKAFSYVSKVNGLVMVHQSWPECEARVRGTSGALYKKALSAEEEKQIVEEWNKK